jgi:hypothetical protein
MLCVVVARGKQSRLVPVWAQEIILMRPSLKTPRADITASILLYCDPQTFPDGDAPVTMDFSVLHMGKIVGVKDLSASICEEQNWMNSLMRVGKGRYEITPEGMVLIDLGKLEPGHSRPIAPNTKIHAQPVQWEIWPEETQSGPDGREHITSPLFTFVRGVIHPPIECNEPRLLFCRLKFSTEDGIQHGGKGEAVYPAFGPDIVQQRLWKAMEKMSKDPINGHAKEYYSRLQQSSWEIQVAKYELVFVGDFTTHYYMLERGSEYISDRRSEEDDVEKRYLDQPIPGVCPEGAPFYYLQPEDLSFKSVVRAIPMLGSGQSVARPNGGSLHERHHLEAASSHWKAHLHFYREQKALKFSTRDDCHKAIHLIWETPELYEVPHDLAGFNSIVIPAEAESLFKKVLTGFGLDFRTIQVQ